MTDAQLVELARQGDRDACDRLVERHQAAVYRAALAAVRVREDAEEIAQDAFVRAFRSLASFRGEASFKTWLLRITWRRALTRRRLNWCMRRRATEEELAQTADPRHGPDAHTRATELHDHLRRLIDRLPAAFRDAQLLARAGDYTYEEVAAILDIPVGTLKWRVSEARRRLRVELALLGYDERS